MVLVNPGFPVSTAWVYASLKPPFEAPNEAFLKRLSQEHPKTWLHNDLEAVTLNRYPELVDLKQALLTEGAVGVLMSGSGPTIFGLFTEPGAAVQAAARLQEATGLWTTAVQGVT
jgi:4-diphosphocytidyl-2-C-methyl-D-erythritol kinase